MAKKNQILNKDKCEVLVVSQTPFPHTHICDVPVVKEMKVLGLIYTHDCKMDVNIKHRGTQGAGKNVLHLSRMYKFGCHHDLRLSNMMLSMDVRPTLVFGACIWGAHKMSASDPMKHPLQSQYSVMQKRALGLPHSTGHWILCLLTGNLPIQHYIIKEFCRFWNQVLDQASQTFPLKAALIMQKRLMRERKKCWLGTWMQVLDRMIPDAETLLQLNSLQRIDVDTIMSHLRVSYFKLVYNIGDPRTTNCVRRRTALSSHLVYNIGFRFGEVPKPMRWPLPHHVRQMWHDFLAANSKLPVHDFALAHIPFHQRLCRKCKLNTIADEYHVVLECTATSIVREQYATKLLWQKHSLRQFVQVNNSRTLPFYIYACMKQYLCAPIAVE